VMKKDCLGPTHLLESVGDVLGIYEDPVFISKQFQLASGDRIFVYTDGVANASWLDAESGTRKKLEQAEFDGILLKHRHVLLDKMVACVWQDILDFCENKPRDDMLFLGIEIP
ncbi:MAG: SpoIIE family protein phosphatase, partial [Desulfobacteraceae bacterium]|nr:SpoIIE family protein phosphatase [Desulfobacteraceae bacterium]